VHAELLYLNGIWILRDLRSTNGTTVNGWRIKTDVAVRPGDVVGFGDMTFVLGSR
jgi:pSer/pThr/pTyr-binding forkhead associated (FHA) protein